MPAQNDNYESFFSYTLSRPYPYRWFTPIAVVGCVILTVLFSILNFAANSYDLVVHTTSDLNGTLAGPSYIHSWPVYFRDKVQTSCEPTQIPVGSQLFTNQTALTYQLEGIWQPSSDGSNTTILASMPYSSNVIENCSITLIGMDLASLDRSGSQLMFTEWGCVAKSYITCAYDSLDGIININLTQTYDLIPPLSYWQPGYVQQAFLDSNNQTRASLWWGEAALANYWVGIISRLDDLTSDVIQSGGVALRKGALYFTPSGDTTDIKDPGFFNVSIEFIDLEGNNTNLPLDPTVTGLEQNETYPNIWLLADSFAKSHYSTILTDLGQSQGPSNFLLNADDLEYFSSNFSYIINNVADITPGDVAETDYDSVKNVTGPLGTTPSVISSQYICQIPQLKSAGNIFISILVADLVFLQTAWSIYTYLVGLYMSRTTDQKSKNDETGETYERVEVTDQK